MTERRPLVIIAGQAQEIPTADTIATAVLPPSSGSRTFAFFAS